LGSEEELVCLAQSLENGSGWQDVRNKGWIDGIISMRARVLFDSRELEPTTRIGVIQ